MKQMTLTEPIQSDVKWQTSRDTLPKKKTKHLEQVFQTKGPSPNMDIYSSYWAVESKITVQNF